MKAQKAEDRNKPREKKDEERDSADKEREVVAFSEMEQMPPQEPPVVSTGG